MISRRTSRWFRAAGLLLCIPALIVVWLAVSRLDTAVGATWAGALVILVLHGLARRFPLRLVARERTAEFTTAPLFAFALLLTEPTSLAVLGLAFTALVPPREVAPPRWIRPIIEVARTLLVYGVATWALGVLPLVVPAGAPPVAITDGSWQLLLIVLPAGLLAYLVEVAVGVSLTAIEHGSRPQVIWRQDRVRYDPLIHLLLICLSPAVVVMSQHSLLLVPLLLLVVIGLYRSSRLVALEQHAALHDGLTGLANRRQLDERLETLMRDDRHQDPFALLIMDLDRFKEVNDQLGHQVGDRLLQEVGNRLLQMEGLDLAARIGGDEFAFLVRHTIEVDVLLDVGERLVQEVAVPYVVNDIRLAIGASVGVATYPDHGTDTSTLLRRADTAMYAAKRSGVAVGFSARDRTSSPGRLSLVGQLEEAMRSDELALDFQPQISLRTDDVVGFEALLRWNHPIHGLILPDAFVATVEHTELIGLMTRHVLRMALEEAARWKLADHPVPVAVNISTRDLQDRYLARDVEAQLAATGLLPGDLVLEITETALQVDPERAGQVLGELKDLGVRLSIDDFGTGYSSLAALQHLPVDELKVDGTFVRRMQGPAGLAIVRSIIHLAHALNLSVVAEGVEDEATVRELHAHRCDHVQGFVVARPLLPVWVVPWLEARAREPAGGVLRTLRRAPIQAPRQRMGAPN